ncbi:transposase [Streptomyces atratus]|uniref:transposase n=1 Tax=Streptomyces atratus TaxID=1893 RepID=UPI00338EF9D3
MGTPLSPLSSALDGQGFGTRPGPGRRCLQGILYVPHSDIARQLLAPELGFGSGQTCRRRLGRWQRAGVFDRLHCILLAETNAAGAIDWPRACVDGAHVRATEGVPTPVRRGSTAGRQAASTI